jgi:hypothetical protein
MMRRDHDGQAEATASFGAHACIER